MVSIIFLFFLFSFSHPTNASAKTIRKASAAGYFYPKDPDILAEMVDRLIRNAGKKTINGNIIGFVSPHAGYVYSGSVAAHAYAQIKNKSYDTVIIVGPSHHVYFRGASIGNSDFYQTPLGNIRVNKKLSNKLLGFRKIFHFVERAHIKEHSIETQLPFLQRTIKNFTIVPILTGALSLEDCKEMSSILSKAVREKNILFIASSDMSHYPNYEDAKKIDRYMLSLIEDNSPLMLYKEAKNYLKKEIPDLVTAMCGINGVVTIMMTIKSWGGNTAKTLCYANSGDISLRGYYKRDRVVGYGAVAFYKK